MSKQQLTVAVVGATGAVGREMLAILESRNFPHPNGPDGIRLLASERSAGTKIEYRGKPHQVRTLTHESLAGVDIALFSAGGSISKEFAPRAAGAGCIVIDNSSAFRMDAGVPLVIPEVNPEALLGGGDPARSAGVPDAARRAALPVGRIIANPNCSTIILLMALTPLRKAFGVERVVVSTYQAASGAGAKGMEELEEQTRADLGGRTLEPKVFHEPYAFNLFSHNTAVDPHTGMNVEETKVIKETHKIWNDASVGISATCIRVPVRRAHAESVNVTLKRPATVAAVRDALARFPGVSVVDDRAGNRFPTPLKASGKDDVLVGRIRPDASRAAIDGKGEGLGGGASYVGFDLFICGDQLRKGAALNAIQIAEFFTTEAPRH